MVMHARKPQRMNDGYFEKHQSHSYQSSKYNSKREYDRDRSTSYRDRDVSPVGSLNNGNSTYRSQSPEIVDSPSSRGHDIRDRGDHRGGGGSDRFSYIQKMRERDRDVYKKDKYTDKRDRRGGNERDSESHRTNHDRIDRRGGAKLCSAGGGDKRSGSDDRDRERDRERDLRDKRDRNSDRDRERERERDRDRERDRNDRGGDRERDRGGNGGGERNERCDRVARCGDWSEHVSSSGKMYYYNCKTEVSQWEKPKEWIEKERSLARDQHREKDYRDKERDRERDDRFSRSAYTKHSSSRGNSRLRWNYDNDGGPPSHRRRIDGRLTDNVDMDISPGDSTPTSEASYSLAGTPTAHGVNSNQHNDQTIPSSAVGLMNTLPRLASHPNASNNMSSNSNTSATSAMHFQSSSVASAGGGSGILIGAPTMLSASGLASTASSSSTTSSVASLQQNSNHRKIDNVSHLTSVVSPTATGTPSSNLVDHHLNSNAPGPPKLGTKESQEMLLNSQQKSNLLMRQQSNQHHHHLSQHGADSQLISGNTGTSSLDAANHALNSTNTVAHGVGSLRDNAINSPLYNLTHPHGMSPVATVGGIGSGVTVGHTNNVAGGVMGSGVGLGATVSPYSCNSQFGLKTVEGSGSGVINSVGSNSICPSSSLTNVTPGGGGNSTTGIIPGDGPPTPTQELDISGGSSVEQQRKLEGTSSASLSTLQSCTLPSVQAARSQGPEISPKLAKYFRADLIAHVTNWPADMLEKQAQKCSEETHQYGDLQCTKVSAELKCARSLVRCTEISATLQDQKAMYLRQQIQRIEESKPQNPFMCDDI